VAAVARHCLVAANQGITRAAVIGRAIGDPGPACRAVAGGARVVELAGMRIVVTVGTGRERQAAVARVTAASPRVTRGAGHRHVQASECKPSRVVKCRLAHSALGQAKPFRQRCWLARGCSARQGRLPAQMRAPRCRVVALGAAITEASGVGVVMAGGAGGGRNAGGALAVARLAAGAGVAARQRKGPGSVAGAVVGQVVPVVFSVTGRAPRRCTTSAPIAGHGAAVGIVVTAGAVGKRKADEAPLGAAAGRLVAVVAGDPGVLAAQRKAGRVVVEARRWGEGVLVVALLAPAAQATAVGVLVARGTRGGKAQVCAFATAGRKGAHRRVGLIGRFVAIAALDRSVSAHQGPAGASMGESLGAAAGPTGDDKVAAAMFLVAAATVAAPLPAVKAGPVRDSFAQRLVADQAPRGLGPTAARRMTRAAAFGPVDRCVGARQRPRRDHLGERAG
jgi:hypothetical protein